MANTIQHEIVIVGGGAAGLTVAARLKKLDPKLEVTLIDPADKHYYQPLWTLVGAGIFPASRSQRQQKDLIPKGVTWIKEAVTDLDPQRNLVVTQSGIRITYKYLVVANGLQVDWDRIAGLRAAIGHDGVCSIYDYQYVEATWAAIRDFTGGTAIFTFPNTAVKCGGAPQKIMYLAEHRFRKNGVRDQSKVIFKSAASSIFAVKKYADALTAVAARRQIETGFLSNLVEVRGAAKEAVFESVTTGEKTVCRYDLLHVTPPMSAPDVIKRSALASAQGWVEVHKHSLQHLRFANVFSLGDVSSLPTSKTAAAIRKQAPVLVHNLLNYRRGLALNASYHGYTSCPLVTGYGKLILAEFDYEGRPQESFPWNQAKERLSMYLLKKYFLPQLYWMGMLKGRA